MKKVSAKYAYPSRCLAYHLGCKQPQILPLDSTEDDSLSKISTEHRDAVIVYGYRYWVNGAERRYPEIKDRIL